MKTSVLVPVMPGHGGELEPYAELVRSGLAGRLWQGQSLGLETFQGFAYLAGRGLPVPVGTSVTLTALRHPYEAALHARSLARLTGHSPVLGVGVGTPELVSSLRGRPYARPLTAAREYLVALRGLLDGKPQALDGTYVRMHGALPEFEHPPVELGLGVLRPGAARLAGEVAEAAITWLTPPGYVREVLVPELTASASAAGRPVPRVVTVVHVALARPHRNPYRTCLSATREHLSAPHYTDMLRRAGLRVHPAQVPLAARTLVDSGTFVTGAPAELISGLHAYFAAGVDEVVLNLGGVHLDEGPEAALADVHEILTALQGGYCRLRAPGDRGR
ncbi:alkanesulfonate monooxygenase SsuD/methylene tetrahydromethanopterin reductase-like flavin-dependent oxidoreductase (luciferase family) [Crossiella equi]|uniref:Alkanesulfonate monooxygenase SsuD/methylene tetrahydromethanopterin reductase-like flavin-dependent oxidoreductase (Luciferase family) n=1 Tax=Crossiella equi TaxID=130796 RepID=A0ABS5ASJ2_9PSEU|nr:LLM class flavin-dependent oxidoreductase [Crossiella equi]MBP2479192.1 alkanesulfonate monooxygenase SsuD/methylene tetrahydromethanopterin reductase-like flavin-dependent oxidoreductase (luciferase family) [Crossiella equi]